MLSSQLYRIIIQEHCHSTLTNLITFNEYNATAFEYNQNVQVVYFYAGKALDRVNHDMLIEKLQQYVI